MTIAALEPVSLRQEQSRAASHVLARAFHTNPAFVWAVPDERQRLPKVRWFMEVSARLGARMGEVHTTPGTIEGAAIWLPPGKTTLTLPQLLRAGFVLGPVKWGIAPFMKFVSVMGRFEKLHKEAIPSHHWYLMVLGVDPPRQGKGLGSALIKPVLRRADEAGLPCYLETDKPDDVAFFQKHGFEVVLKDQFAKDGPDMWTMQRSPRGR